MITVFADKYLYNIDKFIPESCELNLFNPADGLPDNLEGADALLIRTVITFDKQRINKLPDSIQFIATGSAGTDHVDKDLLAERDITFADAAGCNSRSVAEYVATALLLWSDDFGENPDTLTAGVIGKGHAGTEVHRLLSNLGMNTVCYDPPKEERDKNFKSAGLEEVLSADILTFHTPLQKNGKHPTYHWLDDKKLSTQSYKLIINTSRGGVIDEQDLLRAYINGRVKSFVMDVWENEPVFNDLIAENAFIKTPHIAGYSKQAKLRASKIIAESFCRHFSLEMPDYELKESAGRFDLSNANLQSAKLSEVLSRIHPVLEYENEFVKLIGVPPKEKGIKFNKLRSEFPLRNEYKYLKVPDYIAEEHPIIKHLGS